MDITKMLADLRAERDAVSEAIITLERLSAGSGRRRGRPPAWMKKMEVGSESAAAPKKTKAPKKRKAFSAETRKKMAEAQRKRWEAKQAEQNG